MERMVVMGGAMHCIIVSIGMLVGLSTNSGGCRAGLSVKAWGG
jgi:hypothetical protein